MRLINQLSYSTKVISKLLIAMILIFNLTGCGPKEYVDLSHTERFSSISGVVIENKKKLKALGVTFDANYKKRVDYVFLKSFPGTSGPEIVFSKVVSKGSLFKVVGLYSTDTAFFSRYFAKVEVVGIDDFSNYTVLVELNDNLSFDKNIFKVKHSQQP